MIKWRDQPAERGTQPIAALYRSMHIGDVLRVVAALARGAAELPLVIIDRTVRTQVLAHLCTSQAELGGLLIGEAFTRDASGKPDDHIAVVRVVEAIAGADYASTAISLQLGTSVWTQARERLRDGRLVVGWYHSHPHLGAFFSGTDRRTQRAFFAQPYSVGWVIDPYATDRASAERFYLGPQARELDAGVIATSHAGL